MTAHSGTRRDTSSNVGEAPGGREASAQNRMEKEETPSCLIGRIRSLGDRLQQSQKNVCVRAREQTRARKVAGTTEGGYTG